MDFGPIASLYFHSFLMKTALSLLLLFTLTFGAHAQRIAIKKDLITVDGQPYARIEQGETREFYISSPQNERLFIVRQLTLQDPVGSANYLQFVFTGSQTLVETPRPLDVFNILYPTTLARMIYSARLLKDGALDPKAVADFAVNYGAPYSERRQALNQPGVVQPAVVVPAVH